MPLKKVSSGGSLKAWQAPRFFPSQRVEDASKPWASRLSRHHNCKDRRRRHACDPPSQGLRRDKGYYAECNAPPIFHLRMTHLSQSPSPFSLTLIIPTSVCAPFITRYEKLLSGMLAVRGVIFYFLRQSRRTAGCSTSGPDRTRILSSLRRDRNS